tara:strand:- start:205 stop:333 length:129 start_codon:yes stop_codon:yes gene_type:complete
MCLNVTGLSLSPMFAFVVGVKAGFTRASNSLYPLFTLTPPIV